MSGPERRPGLGYGGRRHRDPVPGEPALRVSGLVVRYDPRAPAALGGVDLLVAAGQRVALLGPNGAGKSTLLKAVAGLTRPAEGEIRVFGLGVGACHHRVAYLPQRGELDWAFPVSVAELVTTGRYAHLGWLRRPGPGDRERVAAALERLGLAALAGRQIGELSGGQQQRVLLARAVVQEAGLVLLDEPFNAVDAATRRVLHDVIDGLAGRGCAVVVATHDVDRLGERFDRVVHLAAGRTVAPAGGGHAAGRPGVSAAPQPAAAPA